MDEVAPVKKKPAVRKTSHQWTHRILEILEDGEWHLYRDVVSEVMPLVPPGEAWRKAEKNRQQHYSRQGRSERDRMYGDKNTTIQTGQRMTISVAIRGLRTSGRIEVEYKDPTMTRKRPHKIRLAREVVDASDTANHFG